MQILCLQLFIENFQNEIYFNTEDIKNVCFNFHFMKVGSLLNVFITSEKNHYLFVMYYKKRNKKRKFYINLENGNFVKRFKIFISVLKFCLEQVEIC